MIRWQVPARRQLAAAVVICAAGAALVVVATGRTWAVEVVARPAPLPDERTVREGGDLLPWLPALGWVALAGAGALVAVRGRVRQVLGGLLTATGAGLAVGAGWAAAGSDAGPGWPALAALGGAAVAAAGLLATWRGAHWPAMGARYERARARGSPSSRPGGPGHAGTRPDHDGQSTPEQLWEALDRGEDPTA